MDLMNYIYASLDYSIRRSSTSLKASNHGFRDPFEGSRVCRFQSSNSARADRFEESGFARSSLFPAVPDGRARARANARTGEAALLFLGLFRTLTHSANHRVFQ